MNTILNNPSQKVSRFTLSKVIPSLVLIPLTCATAFANTASDTTINVDDKIGLSVGINVIAGNSPYDVDDNNVTVLPSVFYDNHKIYARGSKLGSYIVKDDKNEFAAFIQPSGNTFDPDDAKAPLSGLDERKWSGMVGLEYMRTTPYGAFRGQIARDVLGNSEGTVAKLSYLAKVTKGDLTVYPSAGVEWVNDTYNQYYYGVSSDESTRTGIKTYSPDSSISPFLSINAFYDINKDWSLFLGQNISYLADEQNDSPIVDNRTNYRTTLGVMYNF